MDISAYQKVLETISRHCPESLSAYLHCINRADQSGSVFFSKDFVDIHMSENFRTFRNNIKKLAREDLLQWHPTDNGIEIILCPIGDEYE